MGNTESAQWLKRTRKGLNLTQSDVSAFLTFKQRKTWNQARINEFENNDKPIPASVLVLLSDFFKQVTRLRNQRRPWTDVFNL